MTGVDSLSSGIKIVKITKNPNWGYIKSKDKCERIKDSRIKPPRILKPSLWIGGKEGKNTSRKYLMVSSVCLRMSSLLKLNPRINLEPQND